MPKFRVLPFRHLLLVLVLIASIGTLLTNHYKTDTDKCPCVYVTKGQLTERLAGISKDKQSQLKTRSKDKQSFTRSSIKDVQSASKLDSREVQNQSKSDSKDTQSILTLPSAIITQSHVTKHVLQTTSVPNKFQPNWWTNHTRTICKVLGMNTDQRTIQPDMLAKVLVDDVHKILYCQIAKVASTNLGKIFAIIAGKFNGTNPDDIDSNDIHFKYNKLQLHLDFFPIDEVLNKLETYFKFVFVRDPFERILSGYRNKFLKPSSSYFAYLSNKLVAKYRTNRSQTGGVTFQEFVTYLVDADRKVPMNGHWQPMHEICRPCETNYDFVGKINSLGEDVVHILEVNKLAGIMEVPKQSSSHSFHKTDLYLEQYFSQLPKPLLLSLYKMYYPDYAIFDYEVPNVILNMMK
uniref:Carbohydrate sulfotransferase n=1 Tax=Arion vulgaris TaxID=1028688 RepID=A0A0B7A5N4_9EUPU